MLLMIYNNQTQQEHMLNMFRSKELKLMLQLLENNGFNNTDFKDYRIGDIAKEIQIRRLLPQFQEIIKQQKMSQVKLLKASLLVLHLLQVSDKIQENSQIKEVIRQLQVKTKNVMHRSRKSIGQLLSPSIKKNSVRQFQGTNTAKQIGGWNIQESPENALQNSVSYILGKLVQPLLHIGEKILYSFQLIYRPKIKMDSDTCWPTLNLLKKFSELSRSIEQIGRYYKEYIMAMVSTIKVLSLDIRILYRRVSDYLKSECEELKGMIQLKGILVKESGQQQKLKQVIMLVQELQKINQNVRVLYCNKYYSDLLLANHIYMPSIFSTAHDNLQIIYSFFEFKNKSNPKQSRCGTSGIFISTKFNKSGELKGVETI